MKPQTTQTVHARAAMKITENPSFLSFRLLNFLEKYWDKKGKWLILDLPPKPRCI